MFYGWPKKRKPVGWKLVKADLAKRKCLAYSKNGGEEEKPPAISMKKRKARFLQYYRLRRKPPAEAKPKLIIGKLEIQKGVICNRRKLKWPGETLKRLRPEGERNHQKAAAWLVKGKWRLTAKGNLEEGNQWGSNKQLQKTPHSQTGGGNIEEN